MNVLRRLCSFIEAIIYNFFGTFVIIKQINLCICFHLVYNYQMHCFSNVSVVVTFVFKMVMLTLKYQIKTDTYRYRYLDTCFHRVVTPSSFQYGNSVDSSRFVHLEDLECNFQPLNFTFHVCNHLLYYCILRRLQSLKFVCFFMFLLENNCYPILLFQVINNGPSRLPGSTVDIRLPNRLVGNGADMFLILDTQVSASFTL